MKKKNYSIISRVIMGTVFAALFIINASALVSKSDKSGDNLSLTALLANASADDAPAEGPPPSKTKCGTDECSKDVALGVPPYQSTVTYYGHYTHCKNAGATDNCTSSSCDVECDAKK